MPLLRVPTTQELEDHFFGSGAFQYDWFGYKSTWIDDEPGHFPVTVWEHSSEDILVYGLGLGTAKEFTEQDFIEGIKKYAETLPDRSFDDLIEDMDSVDVDNVIQLMMFGEIRYS